MKLYRYISGIDEKYGPARDAEDAYDKREEVDPTFSFLAVKIEEVEVPGYTLTLTPNSDVEQWDKGRCREYLDSKGVEYVPQWGVEKLREAVKANQ